MDNFQFLIILAILIITLVGLFFGYFMILRNINHPMLSLHHKIGEFPANQSSDKALSFPADGKWHDIITDLSGLSLVEILAIASGRKGYGKYSMLFAQALNTFGKGNIKTNQAFYSFWYTGLALRWKRDKLNYNLQIKTKTDYGADCYIQVFLKQLYQSELTSDN